MLNNPRGGRQPRPYCKGGALETEGVQDGGRGLLSRELTQVRTALMSLYPDHFSVVREW